MTEAILADTPLATLDERSVGLALSAPLSERLDALVRLVEASGDRTSRKELIAALILAATPNGEDLAGCVRSYRTALARDALLDPDRAPDELASEVRKPGPRRRRPV
jgi:hypothetical protein